MKATGQIVRRAGLEMHNPVRSDREVPTGELRFAEWKGKVLACIRAEFAAGREQARTAGSSRQLGPIKWATLRVFETLVDIYMDRTTKECWPSLEELATAAGVGYSSAKAATKTLRELGWLAVRARWVRTGHSNPRFVRTSNLYKIKIPRRWTRYFRRTAILQRTTLRRYLKGRVLVQMVNMSMEWHEAVFRIAQRKAQPPSSETPTPTGATAAPPGETLNMSDWPAIIRSAPEHTRRAWAGTVTLRPDATPTEREIARSCQEMILLGEERRLATLDGGPPP